MTPYKIKFYIGVLFPIILSLYSNRVNYESEEVEFPHSASSLFNIQKDSVLNKKYNSALNLYKKGDYYKSLEETIYIAENTSDVKLIFKINKLNADIYESINDHRKVIFYYKKILNYVKDSRNSLDIDQKIFNEMTSNAYLKLGSSYTLIPKRDSAIYYFEKLLKINSLNKKIRLDQGAASNTLSGIYFYFDENKDLKKAEKYARDAIKIHEELNDNLSLVSGYTNLGSIYMENGNPKKAKELYFKALDFIKDDNRLKAVKYKEVLYDNLGWAMYNLKDYISYDYLDKSIFIRDSLRDVSKADIIKELEIKHNNDTKLRAIETQKKLAQRNTWLVGGIGAGSILLLMFFVSYYKLRQRNLSLKLSENELVQQKNIEKIKIEAQTKILNATLDGKETERKLIAETLHDNVSAMLSSANLHLQASQKQFNGSVPEELKKTQKIIKEASQQIRDLSHNLVSSVLLKFGLEYAVNDIAEKYSNSILKIHVDVENIKRYNQDSEIKIYNIIQELINNTIKHSNAKNAFIKLFEESNNLYLNIEDDGIGFDKNTAAIKNSVGLNQIDARIKMLKGTFFINSNKETGTEVNISIPINEIKETNNA